MEEAAHDAVYSSFVVCYPEEQEERRILGVKNSMRRGSVEQVNTHMDLRIRAAEKV